MSGLGSHIGAQLVVGLPGGEPTDKILKRLDAMHVQSVIAFERNAPTAEALGDWVRRLRNGLERRLVVMIDHEGGRIDRVGSGLTHFPGAAEQGAKGADAVFAQGKIEASELKALGVSVNLAPCVDVVRGGSDPVIGNRSYGGDAEQVGELGAARVRGLQSAGVAACAKHFPGLGAVGKDPHYALPTIHVTLEQLREMDWVPFEACIRERVALIMSSHVCYPAVDASGLPATFSPFFIEEILRGVLGFKGIAITDAMEMGALSAFGGIEESAVRAVEAGHDQILVCCEELAAAEAVFGRLRKAYASGELSEERLMSSVERIEKLRKTYLGA